LVADVKKWEGERIMVKVYDNLQEEIKLKGEDVAKLEKALDNSTVEIRDLESEFQAERTDYLDTIRKMEREIQLQNQILEKMQPLVRRDCNYSNIDRMKILAEFDEENSRWRIPEVAVERVSLPKAVPGTTDGLSTMTQSAEVNIVDYQPRGDVDRYAYKIQANHNEQYSNQYFKPKRADKLLSGGSSPSVNLNLNNSTNNNNSLNSLTKLQPLTSPTSSTSIQDPMMARRPQKLEALPLAAFEKKKKKNKNKDQ